MTTSRILPVILSITVIILVAVIQERSKFLAAIVATMPVSAPLALWIVYAANKTVRNRWLAYPVHGWRHHRRSLHRGA
jgi:hypothetical protein